MRVGLRQHRGNPPQPRGEHHRPGDVAAAAEHDVGPAPVEDAQARERRGGSERDGAEERETWAAREARHRERVERVAALRNEPRLDAIRRPGERHLHPARAQGLRHGERRGEMPDRPARRYQAPKLSALLHGHGRC